MEVHYLAVDYRSVRRLTLLRSPLGRRKLLTALEHSCGSKEAIVRLIEAFNDTVDVVGVASYPLDTSHR
ncbi:Hypothetical protein FKW44_013172 [Caligus rogercresseyi]|uniref:Uncharacterized protein n=1 Tax=Caligus rogercresseyi TaxID=217165 RepID=A0A7T8KAT7_CALRO|nr:Hypothetical protein FKW44_013172 [Caligus rogercresseyi]